MRQKKEQSHSLGIARSEFETHVCLTPKSNVNLNSHVPIFLGDNQQQQGTQFD